MHFKSLVAVAAIAAAMSLPFAVHAQETHVLTPHFPDAFKLRTTTVTDTNATVPNQTGGSETRKSHSSTTWTTDAHKTADGYHATVAMESMDTSAPAASASPAAGPAGVNPADMQQQLTAVFKLLGNAEVSYDSRMKPVRVDNLDTLRGNVKNMMSLSASSQDAAKMNMIFDMLLSDITPESAAQLLRQSGQSRTPYDKPLALNTAVPMDDGSFKLFGATLKIGGTVTLNSWEDGKAAHLTYVTQPAEADVRRFAVGVVNGFLNKIFAAMGTESQKPQLDQAKVMVARVIDNTSIKMVSTCKVDINLANTALQHSDCNSDIDVTVDMSKLMTEEQLKANPGAAAGMKVITFKMGGHAVSDTVLVGN